MSAYSRLTEDMMGAALRRLGAGESLRAVVADLPVGEPAFRWRYKQLFGRGLSLRRKRPPDFLLPASQTVLAYMAGIIDGEGWISVNANRHKQNRSWTVAFASTDRKVIDFFGTYGGRVYHRCDKSLRGGTIKSVKPQWTWGLHRALNVLVFLDGIIPYMVIKKARAEECVADLRQRLASHLDRSPPLGETIELAPPILLN